MIETPRYLLQETMMESVNGAVGDADAIVLVTDVYSEDIADQGIYKKLRLTRKPVLVAVNKIDLLSNATVSLYHPSSIDSGVDQGSISTENDVVISKKKSPFFRTKRMKAAAKNEIADSPLDKRLDGGDNVELTESENYIADYMKILADDEENSDEKDAKLEIKTIDEILAIWRERYCLSIDCHNQSSFMRKLTFIV